ncbi:MAG: transcriptional regulator [Actinoallomurus sp.]|jgi:hypothetical protein|nr:transcriptional regulator [Actinoallomurus sp.]
MTGRCWSALGNPARAIPALTDALRRYDDTHARDKALYLTWLADAHIDDDDIGQAAATARRAVALAADIASVRPRQRINDLIGRLERHRTMPAVAALIEEAEWLLRRSTDPASPGMRPSRREA